MSSSFLLLSVPVYGQYANDFFHEHLAGYYDLDRYTGSFGYERSQYANTGSPGTGLTQVAGHKGAANTACHFDGTSNATIGVSPNASFDPSNGSNAAISVSCWVKPASAAPGYPDNRQIWMMSDGTNNWTCTSYSLFFNFNSNRFLVGNWSMGSSVIYSYSSNTYARNQWHHVVLIFDPVAGSADLYVDNNLDMSVSATLALPNAPELCIGYHNIFGWNFSGDIDEFRVHNEPLNTSQIGTLYNDILTAFYPLSNYYAASNGTDAMDESGHENHLTGGMVTTTADRNSTSDEAYSFAGGAGDYCFGTDHTSIDTKLQTGNGMAIWVYPIEGPAGVLPIYHYMDFSGNSLNLGYDFSTNRFVFENRTTVSLRGFSFLSRATYNPGQWHHVVVNSYWTGTVHQTSLYVDGILDRNVSGGFFFETPDRPYVVLGNDFLGATWNGYMDGLRVYDRWLSGGEVTAIHGASFNKGALGTAEVAGNNVMTIFPNPAQGTLFIHAENLTGSDVLLTISDQLGRKVLGTRPKNVDGQVSADISSLNPGIYFATVTGEKGLSFTQKFLVR